MLCDNLLLLQLLSLLNRIKTAQKQGDGGLQQASTLSSLKGFPSLSTTREVQHIKLQDESEREAQQCNKLQDSSDVKLLTESARTSTSLDKKFNLELNALLSDDDSNIIDEKRILEGGKFGSNSLESGVDSTLTKSREIDVQAPDKGEISGAVRNNAFGTTSLEERQTSQPANIIESTEPLSVDIPDYSPDFNSESEKIGNMLQEEKVSENNARYVTGY